MKEFAFTPARIKVEDAALAAAAQGLTPFLQMIWKRMLEAVDFIHSQRVIHSDLKPANFLFVKGELKLIDFGIARSMNSDTTNIQVTGCACSFWHALPSSSSASVAAHTHAAAARQRGRYSKLHVRAPHERCVVQRYNRRCCRAPEAVAQQTNGGLKLGRPSDVWSLGCIL